MERIEEWPPAVQQEAVSALEAIAGYVSLYEPLCDDR